ncbi:SH3 domain-containing protein [Leptospira santarosai]|nr:SH3 domain-containing protein [Leptospira santarosai]MDI7206497.1 SH3 domain-containing protein [Leptospira santarosai]MDI7230038.1 SH3 domain-containing protein [Leptospira santarosai]
MMKIIQFTVLIGVLLVTLSTFAEKNESIVKCSTSAYSTDSDPAGTNIRDSPKGKILTSVPHGTTFKIIGYSKGWFQIKDISYNVENEAEVIKRGHKAEDGFVYLNGLVGWIYSERTEVHFEGMEQIDLYSIPEYGDPIFTYNGNRINQVTILSCRGNWFHIDFNKGEKKGWVHQYCGNSLTNCS